MTLLTTRTRYGIAHEKASGLYGWAHAHQSRHFFDSREAAEAWLEAAQENSGDRVKGWFVSECKCWNHGDAIATVWAQDAKP